MGWPRKNESCRLYYERKDKSYLLVIVENGQDCRGCWDAIGNVFQGSHPRLCGTSASPGYLLHRCRRVEWSELPREWQRAFRAYMTYWDEKEPRRIRGFWKITKPCQQTGAKR